MASSCRSRALAAAVVAAVCAAPLQSQTPPAPRARGAAGPLILAGRAVLVGGRDTTPLARALVVAHRIGRAAQGPIDSQPADGGGRFRFRVARPDTTAMYVVSTRYRGIGYFSTPVPATDPAAADTLTLAVYDTSSSGAPLQIGVRHVVISAPGTDGARDVLDIVQVQNLGPTTRVQKDSASATWRMRLPAGVQSFQVAQSDVPESAVARDGDTVLVRAPFPPGGKQVVLTYVVPASERRLAVPIDQPAARLEMLIEDSSATASGAGLVPADPVQLEGRTFRRFTAAHVAAGQVADLGFGSRGRTNLTWLAVVLSAALLAAGGWAATRRRPGAAPPGGGAAPAEPEGGDALLRQIVALDERYASRRAEVAPAEWAEYQNKRAALKARLAERLARR